MSEPSNLLQLGRKIEFLPRSEANFLFHSFHLRKVRFDLRTK